MCSAELYFKSKDKTKTYSDKQNQESVLPVDHLKELLEETLLQIKKIPERKVGGGNKLVQSWQ